MFMMLGVPVSSQSLSKVVLNFCQTRPNVNLQHIIRNLSCSVGTAAKNSENFALGADRRPSNTMLRNERCVATTWPHNSSTTSMIIRRNLATKRKEVVQSRDKDSPSALTTGQRVKQAGKDATYTGIVIGGIAVTGIMFFAIGRELLSGNSPSGVYSRAFKLCKKNEEIIDAIGEPIKGYGETTRRGRRRHVSHSEYEVDGVRHMRMRFYIEGPFNKGTVQCEVVKNASGSYNFRYLFVTLDGYPHSTIIIEDNR